MTAVDGDREPAVKPNWRDAALGVTGSYLLLGLMISLSAGLANGSLAFVSQPVKVRAFYVCLAS